MSVEPKSQGGPEIESLLAATRTFPPDPAFMAQAAGSARPTLRRLLRDIADPRTLGDVTTVAEAPVVDTIPAKTGRAEEE